MIGIIEGIGQLVHPIIGFTVSIETNSHGNTEKSQGEKLQLVVIIRPSRNMHMQKSAEPHSDLSFIKFYTLALFLLNILTGFTMLLASNKCAHFTMF